MSKNVLVVLAGASLSTFIIFYLFSDVHTALIITAIVTVFSLFYTLATATGGVNKFLKQMQAEEIYEGELIEIVRSLAGKAGIKTPRVAIVRENIINACALGTISDSVIVFYEGLLKNFSREEIEAIAGHEIGHIKSGDSIAKQGMFASIKGISYVLMAPFFAVSFAFMFFIGPEIFILVSRVGLKLAHYIFGFFGSILINAFSRRREYVADQTAMELTSTDAITSVLNKLKRFELSSEPDPFINSIGFARISATHPSLDQRIENIKKHTK